MTPAERQLVSDLFDRLATLEDAERDPEAERLIRDGLRQAPNALYSLVQTVLVQEETLKRADARIRELEDQYGMTPEPRRGTGFLDNMRDAVFGRQDGRRGSVPSVRPGAAPMGAPTGSQTGAAPMPTAEPSRGGSFLGTAAAAAAGVIGGSMLLDGIRSMSGQRSSGSGGMGLADPAAAAPSRDGGSPWGGAGGGSSELARQAGLGDVGSGTPGSGSASEGRGLFDTAAHDPADEEFDEDSGYDDGFDLGGDDGND
jgi:hypothetical protein